MADSESWMAPSPIWHSWSRPALPVVVVAVLLSLGVSNIAAKVNWRPFDDGVFWTAGAQGVVANIIAADATAKRSGLRVNDLLLAIDDEPVQRPSDVSALLQKYNGQNGLRYTILRSGSQVLAQRTGNPAVAMTEEPPKRSWKKICEYLGEARRVIAEELSCGVDG